MAPYAHLSVGIWGLSNVPTTHRASASRTPGRSARRPCWPPAAPPTATPAPPALQCAGGHRRSRPCCPLSPMAWLLSHAAPPPHRGCQPPRSGSAIPDALFRRLRSRRLQKSHCLPESHAHFSISSFVVGMSFFPTCPRSPTQLRLPRGHDCVYTFASPVNLAEHLTRSRVSTCPPV